MNTILETSINTLTPHPRNHEFFDDTTGEAWDEFLNSVRTSGVIEPIVITQDNVIVSGHQRVRACGELGIPTITAKVETYESEDAVLKDLIETNVRQRGIGNPNPVKLGRCIKELERIYGIQHGGDRKSNPQIADLKSQEDLAAELGMSADTLNRYKKLADLIPEVEDFLDTGMITPSTALAIARQLCKDDQVNLLAQLDQETKYTSREIQGYIDEIKRLKENPPLPGDYSQLKSNISTLSAENSKLKETINKKNLLLREAADEGIDLQQKYDELLAEREVAEEKIKQLKKEILPRAGQEVDIAYDFARAVNSIIRDFSSDLVYGDFFKNNANNEFEAKVINACELIIDFANSVLKNQCTGDYREIE